MLSEGLRRYHSVLSLPGARGPVAASILGSRRIGMFGLAILLLTRDATGSYAPAGRVAGAFGLANAIGAVLQGRLMDRLAPPRGLGPPPRAHRRAGGGGGPPSRTCWRWAGWWRWRRPARPRP